MTKSVSTCELLTTAELAERLKISVATARRWRHNGKGPNYVRLGHNDVRYGLNVKMSASPFDP